jgi:DnaJ-class molecular chaperone
MKVPPGTQPDAQLFIRSKGIRMMNAPNRRGNQYVKLKVTIPTKLTERQKELLREFSGEITNKATDGSSTSTSSSSSSNNDGIINQAWNRLKEFMGKSSTKSSSSSSSPSSSTTSEKDKKAESQNKV